MSKIVLTQWGVTKDAATIVNDEKGASSDFLVHSSPAGLRCGLSVRWGRQILFYIFPFLNFKILNFSSEGLRSRFSVRWGRRILWQLVLWQEDFGKELCAGWRILLFRIFCWYSCLCFEWYLFSLTSSPPMTFSRVEFRVFARQLKLPINNKRRQTELPQTYFCKGFITLSLC